MLNSNDSSDDTRQEKLALLKYTYEKDGIKNNEIEFKLNVG